MGGRERDVLSREYRKTEASQSSSKRGSSSRSDFSLGKRVERSARWDVSERRGNGYESGAERRRICTLC